MKSTYAEFDYLGNVLEGFFYGLYSGIFAMYLQYHGSMKDTANSKTKNIVFYALCVLYVLSFASIFLDIVNFATPLSHSAILDNLNVSGTIVNGCCDFISQSILVYRCWIVWGRNIRIVIIPSILAFIFLATWVAVVASFLQPQDNIFQAHWGIEVIPASLAMSMTVNALATGLISFRIFKVLWELKLSTSDGNQSLGKLRSIIFIVIESGMALFSIQFARLVLSILFIRDANTLRGLLRLIICIYPQLNGITPTIILVRASMGLSFNDQNSLEEAIGSLCFASDPDSEAESVGIVNQERREDDIDVERISNNIELVDT